MNHLLLVVGILAITARGAEFSGLTFTRTIPLANVQGRIDHLAIDAQGQRLFVAALGNDTVEVIDLDAGKRIRTLTGCSEPQGLGFLPDKNRLVIADGGSGIAQILDGKSLEPLARIKDLPDADNVRYDTKSGLIYIRYGGGALAVIDPQKGTKVGDIPLRGHPESFQLEKDGRRIFVNVPDAHQIAVVNRGTKSVAAAWPLDEFQGNFPMALDEMDHRLFVGCRRPARLVVLDTTTGTRISDLKIDDDTDDVFYDAKGKSIYVSCGGGFIDVVAQRSADSYELRGRIATRSGARTSYFSPERQEFFLAVRAGTFSGAAAIRVFQVR